MNDLFQFHKRATLVVAMLALLLAITIAVSVVICRDSFARVAADKKLFEYVRNQLQELLDTREILHVYQSEFDSLIKAGKIGTLDRLPWMEAFDSISKSLQIPDLKYEISNVEQPGEEPVQPVLVILQMRFLHDIQMYAFFEAMYQRVPYLFTITEFEVSRITAPARPMETDDLTQGLLVVNCRIVWHAVPPRSLQQPA